MPIRPDDDRSRCRVGNAGTLTQSAAAVQTGRPLAASARDRYWQMNRLTVAQEHYCTAATQMIMSQLYPYIFEGERNGRVLVATCVAENLHEIGVRMVTDFFEMDGWDTFYLGANVPTASRSHPPSGAGAARTTVSARPSTVRALSPMASPRWAAGTH